MTSLQETSISNENESKAPPDSTTAAAATPESPAAVASTTADYAPLAAKDAEPYDMSGLAESQKAEPVTSEEPPLSPLAAQPTHDVRGTQDQQQTQVHDDESPAPTLPARPTHDETVPTELVAPEVAGLQAMFPDFDVTILYVFSSNLASMLHSSDADTNAYADANVPGSLCCNL